MNDGYLSGRNVVYLNQIHFIWCTKYRKKLLDKEIRGDLKKIFKEVCEPLGAEILALEIMEDHVHIFVSFDPRIGSHKLVKKLKGKSSNILRTKYERLRRQPSLWTHSYFHCSVGRISNKTVKKYIENQYNK